MAHILLADDDDLVADLVRDAFIAHGHGIGVVDNGADALRALSAKRPDLLILDCNMPELSGMLTLRAIRESMPLHGLPVLMLTGRRSKTDVDLAMREGANGYVKKPFDPDFLVFRAEEIIAAHQAQPLRVQTGRAAPVPGNRSGLWR